MVDHQKYQLDLITLLEKKNYSEYLQLMNMIFSNIEEKIDVDNFVVIFLQLENSFTVYKLSEYSESYINLLVIIRARILTLLNNGTILSADYLYLDLIFKNFTLPKEESICQKIDFFSEDILKMEWNNTDFLIENDILFLLEILEGANPNKFLDYLKRITLSNLHTAINNKYLIFIEQFIILNQINLEIILKMFKNNLQHEKYMHYTIYQRRSLIAWIYELVHNQKAFGYNVKTQSLYPTLKFILNYHIKNKEIEEVMYLEFVILILNVTTFKKQEEWKRFTNDITKPSSMLYQKYGEDHNLEKYTMQKKEKKTIAFLFERLIQHSPFKVMYSFFKALQKNQKFVEKYTIVVYSLNYYSKMPNHQETLDMIVNLGIKVIFPVETYTLDDTYSSRMERALTIRKKLINDNIDIMIACFNHYDILNFLFATRVAQQQLFWSHGGCSYDVTGIDKRITNFEQDCKEFDFEILQVSMASEFFVGSKQEKEDGVKVKQLLLEKYGSDKKFIGTIGRLIKIDSNEYLEVISNILKKDKNIIYLACGTGNQLSLKEKLKKFNIDENQFIFLGQVNPHIYGWVLDLIPDSFPLGQGSSKDEYIAKGGCVIMHQKRFETSDYLRLYIAHDDQEYSELVLNTLYEDKYRDEIYKSLRYDKNRLSFTNLFMEVLER